MPAAPAKGPKNLMRCSTCGETIFDGEDRCPTCGAAVARGRRRVSISRRKVRQCPRCGHRGEAVPYFQKPGHLGLLVGLSIFTYGIGGLIYYASRRAYRVCPGCGFGWEHSRRPDDGDERDTSSPVPARPRAPAPPPDAPLPPSGIGRRVFGGALAVLATVMVTAGLATSTLEAVVAGSFCGMAGSGMFLWGWKALQERRQSVIQALNRKVLRLATERRGILTVTDVAAALNLTLQAAEKIMIGMDDGFRVRSDISKEGVLYYEFPEVLHQKKLRAGD